MTLRVDLLLVVIITLGYLTVQRAHSNNVRQLIHQVTLFRNSLSADRKKNDRYWEFITIYCFHY